MSKNYFLPKTGHEASDEYFKKAPIYCDSDMLRVGFTWFVIGIVLGLLILL
jgi:hypothetical protein